ncbi:MAG: hypothetical protein JW882_03205 [Deltaproteobacteria bacterium]|nr:hypothetical protein [Deltaproteobacteria bacterium]
MVIKKRTGYVLGISCIYGSEGMGHDPSAALLHEGKIVALAAEERFNRIKKSPGRFPVMAINYCLDQAGIQIEDVDYIGWYSDPDSAVEVWKKGKHSSLRKMAHALDDMLGQARLNITASEVLSRKKRAENYLKQNFFRHFRLKNPPVIFINHHLCHLASAFYTSGFSETLLVAWDSGGDLLSVMTAVGKGQDIRILNSIPFSRMSMGALYKIFQRYVNLSDEGSLMGLASYGRPKGSLDFSVDIDNLRVHWDKINRPVYYFGKELLRRLGPQRLLGEPISQGHVQIASDVQDILERMAFKILEQAGAETSSKNLCLSGGVALNATMNGKIARSNLFENVYVHPNAGDGGCALGAAFLAYKQEGGRIENRRLTHVYWGREFSNDECKKILDAVRCKYSYCSDEHIPEVVSKMLEDQKIIAWFRGKAEWGPRALGNRSIIADPRKSEMQDKVNDIIKYRDEWRPFAPSILEEAADDYLENSFYSPFMLYTFKVKKEKKDIIPAVVHKDGTTRPQMVRRDINVAYYEMIKRFGEKTGVPVILNTSFNIKGEPIVDAPIDAIKCFAGSGLDVLVLNNFILEKNPG